MMKIILWVLATIIGLGILSAIVSAVVSLCCCSRDLVLLKKEKRGS